MNFFYLFALSYLLSACHSGNDATHRSPPNPVVSSPVATFSTPGDSSARILLTLRADSTYHLRISPVSEASAVQTPLDLRGKWELNKSHYRLYFPDTLTQINDLFSPRASDASLVIYPDHSVTLDTALQQFYVLGVAVERQ